MTTETLIQIIKITPLVILSIGTLLLVYNKNYKGILFGVIGLLALEVFSFVLTQKSNSDHLWTFYFSGPLYLLLIHSIYDGLSLSFLNKKSYKIMMSIVLITMLIGIVYIHDENPNFVLHYTAIIELLVLLYPIFYFVRLMKQTIPYNFKEFILHAIIFLFFSLEIILFVMLKFLLDNNILSDVRIGLFRFFLIQLFYISLIYFGCKLGKK
ncbi:hypothetical protein [Kordia sp.]|uniref:hypothetical protein n=1 Tax=Kordia sp. TaxID=1965332 RepID=UPI003D2B0422